MIVAIVSHTPLWVWPLLAFLLYRGWQASRDRETAIPQALAVPLVMLWLSLTGLLGSVAAHPLHALLGAGALLLSAVFSFRSRAARALHLDATKRRLIQRGSWQPLLLTAGIFAVKYTAAVLLALHPQLARAAWFALPQAALYGAFSGVFCGRLLRIVHLYRNAGGGDGRTSAAAG